MTLQNAQLLIANKTLQGEEQQLWADLGSGAGLFSKALLNLLPQGSCIHAVDKTSFNFMMTGVHFIKADFEKDTLPFSSLDGIMMANALHFIKDKISLLQKLKEHLKAGGSFLLIEYDTDIANRWVPFPLSFPSALQLFAEAGFTFFEKINERPSMYHRSKIYSAIAKEK